MAAKSKILIIGGSGSIGQDLVEASIKAGHPTFVLVRGVTLSDPTNSELLKNKGSIYDHEDLVKAIKQVDVVISAVGGKLIFDQDKILAAIKEAGTVKRYIPSHWGSKGKDVDFNGVVNPARAYFEAKKNNGDAVESSGIPYTYISCNGFAGFFVAGLSQHNATAPPRDKVLILGDGNTQGIFIEEKDTATYTIKAVDDPRTLNTTVHIRPSTNILTFNEMVSLWENKIGITLKKVYIPEDQILQNIKELEFPWSIHLSIRHAVWVRGIMLHSKSDTSGVDATEIYPEVKYTTMDEYLDQFV